MPIEPYTIYSLTATSYSLAKDVTDIVKDIISYKKDLEELGNRYQDKQRKFDILKAGFDRVLRHIKPEYQQFLVTISLKLNEKLTAAKSKLQEYKRWQWPVVKKAMTSAVDALTEWTRSFADWLCFLPLDLKQAFQDEFVNDEYKADRDGPLAALHAQIKMKATDLKILGEDRDKILATIKTEPPDEREPDIRRFLHPKDIISIPLEIREAKDAQKRIDGIKLEVARLAMVLTQADPKTTHLPKAISWFERRFATGGLPHEFGIAYEVQADAITQYPLKEVIGMGPPRHALSDRIKLTIDFVAAMVYVHGLEWVHKAIRSSNVLLCFSKNDGKPPERLGYVNLVGFNIARRGTGNARSTSDSEDNRRNWQRQLYCHPERQTITMRAEDERDAEAARAANASNAANGAVTDHAPINKSLLSPATPNTLRSELPYYTYKHDIYSMGVVLLEIGIWEDLTVAEPGLEYAVPDQRKTLLLNLARKKLPIIMGRKYFSIVEDCLGVDVDGPGVSEILTRLTQLQL